MSHANFAPVAIAQQLLELVTSAFPTSPTGSNPETALDPLALYNAKIGIQDLCDKLMQNVLGRLEYTVLLAGEPTSAHTPTVYLTRTSKNHARRVLLWAL